MMEIKIFEESMPDDIFTFNGSIIYKGHLINIFMDDYGQSWHIQYEKDGKLVDESCGTYCDWRDYVEWRFRNE